MASAGTASAAKRATSRAAWELRRERRDTRSNAAAHRPQAASAMIHGHERNRLDVHVNRDDRDGGAGEPSEYRRGPKVPAPRPPPEHTRGVGGHRGAPENRGVEQHEAEADRQPANAERMQGEMDDVDVCPGDHLLQEAFVSGQDRRGDDAGHDVHRRDARVADGLRVVAQPEPRPWTGEAPPDQRVGRQPDERRGCQGGQQHVGRRSKRLRARNRRNDPQER